MSAIRSASSTTTLLILETSIALRSIKSINRPGVAIMMSIPAAIVFYLLVDIRSAVYSYGPKFSER